jgi:hypothetical protein
MQLFARQCGHRAQAGRKGDGQSYSQETLNAVRHIKAEDLDRLRRDGKDFGCLKDPESRAGRPT